jgi:hypothetical protein
MLTCEKLENGSDFSREVYDRLFEEALPGIGSDRLKHGPEKLKQFMLYMLEGTPVRVWKKDGYIVGIEAYEVAIFNEKKYFKFRFPLVGVDKDGSKAWWYEQTELAVDYYRNEGFNGLFIVYSPGSPVSEGGKDLIMSSSHFDHDSIIDQPMSQYAGNNSLFDDKWGFLVDLIEKQ